MRVLFVAPELPCAPLTGAHTRPLSIMRALAAAGHEIVAVGTVASPSGEAVVADEVSALCAEVLSVPAVDATPRGRGTLSRARKWLSPVPLIGRSRNASVAGLVEAACHEYRPNALHLTTMYAVHYRFPGLPAVVDLTDVVSGLCETAAQARPMRYAAARAQASSARRQERRLLADVVPVTINHDDRARLARLGISAYTVPLAFDLPESAGGTFATGPSGEGTAAPLELLFVGSMLHAPNLEAARFLVEKLAPELRRRGLRFRLVIAGRAAHPEAIGLPPTAPIGGDVVPADTRRVAGAPQADGVVFCPDVPDLAPLYRQADIVLVPLPHGGGTKNKTLEAMAYARPVVGTNQAFTGIDPRVVAEIEQGVSAGLDQPVHVAGVRTQYDAAALAAAIAELTADPARREHMGRAGREYVAARHSQELVNRRVRVLYDAIDRSGGVAEAEAAWAEAEAAWAEAAETPGRDTEATWAATADDPGGGTGVASVASGERPRVSPQPDPAATEGRPRRGASESRSQAHDSDANGGGADG